MKRLGSQVEESLWFIPYPREGSPFNPTPPASMAGWIEKGELLVPLAGWRTGAMIYVLFASKINLWTGPSPCDDSVTDVERNILTSHQIFSLYTSRLPGLWRFCNISPIEQRKTIGRLEALILQSPRRIHKPCWRYHSASYLSA
eukprot:764786-Hanusia_phi.AAC.3